MGGLCDEEKNTKGYFFDSLYGIEKLKKLVWAKALIIIVITRGIFNHTNGIGNYSEVVKA